MYIHEITNVAQHKNQQHTLLVVLRECVCASIALTFSVARCWHMFVNDVKVGFHMAYLELVVSKRAPCMRASRTTLQLVACSKLFYSEGAQSVSVVCVLCSTTVCTMAAKSHDLGKSFELRH